MNLIYDDDGDDVDSDVGNNVGNDVEHMQAWSWTQY
jgi:hypothetical protein